MTDTTSRRRRQRDEEEAAPPARRGGFGKWIALAVVGVLGLWVMGAYNGLINKDEYVKQTFSQVQNVLERQAELIPNLAETVKGYATHEQRTFIDTAAARAGKAAQRPLNQAGLPATDAEIANSEALQKQLRENQAAVLAAGQQAMLAINAVREAHPQLKADRLFVGLMAELTGSQNRITTERRRNQLAIQDFNRDVRTFPGSLIASMFGFKALPYFEAREDAKTAPKIKF